MKTYENVSFFIGSLLFVLHHGRIWRPQVSLILKPGTGTSGDRCVYCPFVFVFAAAVLILRGVVLISKFKY